MLFYISYIDMKPRNTKRQVTSSKEKNDIKTQLNQLPNIHILRTNPTSRWVDFKTTHELGGCTQNLHMHVYQLGAIKNLHTKPITLPIQPTFDSSTLIPIERRCSHNASVGQSQQMRKSGRRRTPHTKPQTLKPSQIAFRAAQVPFKILPSPHFSKTDP